MMSQRVLAPIDKALGRSALQYIREYLSVLGESQGHRAQAMTFAGRRRSIRKHMTQMAPAARAAFFNTDHPIAGITHTPDMGSLIRFEETRRTGPGIKFRAGSEERQTAEATGVNPVFVIVEKHAAEGSFGKRLGEAVLTIRLRAGAV